MMTNREKLLSYLHSAVFDKAADPVLAMRIHHANGLSWTIKEQSLVCAVGGIQKTYDLSAVTLSQLAAALTADGIVVDYLSSEFASYSAFVLIEGSGNQSESSGDHLYAFTSIEWALMSTYANEVRHADDAKTQALRQMRIQQSEDVWAELWGKLFGVERLNNETDAHYANRIPVEAMRLRVNRFAIEKAIHERTGHEVEIREPWKKRFILGQSALSGDDHFSDSTYYSYFVIHPVAKEYVEWSDVLAEINRNRAAGIEVYTPSIEYTPFFVDAEIATAQHVAIIENHSSRTWLDGENPLGVMRLSDNEITLNHEMLLSTMSAFITASANRIDDTWVGGWTSKTWYDNLIVGMATNTVS